MKVPIMIIDDHEIFRNGLRNLNNNTSRATCCGEASSIETALDLIKKTNRISCCWIYILTGAALLRIYRS